MQIKQNKSRIGYFTNHKYVSRILKVTLLSGLTSREEIRKMTTGYFAQTKESSPRINFLWASYLMARLGVCVLTASHKTQVGCT